MHRLVDGPSRDVAAHAAAYAVLHVDLRACGGDDAEHPIAGHDLSSVVLVEDELVAFLGARDEVHGLDRRPNWRR